MIVPIFRMLYIFSIKPKRFLKRECVSDFNVQRLHVSYAYGENMRFLYVRDEWPRLIKPEQSVLTKITIDMAAK